MEKKAEEFKEFERQDAYSGTDLLISFIDI